jgi:hypothetical protein
MAKLFNGGPMKKRVGAIVLIGLGIIFLANNLGIANIHLRAFFRTWWPVILIVVGFSLLIRRRSSR